MRGLVFGFLCVALVAGSGVPLARPAFAQAEPSSPVRDPMDASGSALSRMTPRLAGPIDPRTYRLGPGDQLVLEFSGRISRSVPLEVDPEGGLTLPGFASLPVSERTLADVRADVVRRIGGQFRGVTLDLRLARPRVFRIYLAGEVKAPGAVEVQGGSSVADVLVAAQLNDAASRRSIEVRARDGSVRRADLERFYRAGDDSANPQLRDGDVLVVPVARQFVYVFGAVARAGRYEMGERDSVSTVLKLAGGLLPVAIPEHVLLVSWRDARTPDSTWIDLTSSSPANNPELGNESHVYVYYQPQFRQQHEATLWGEMHRPGTYPITEGQTRLSDLIRAGGGFTALADLASIRVHRANDAGGRPDPEFDRLVRLSRNELTATEYEALRTKLAGQREDYVVSWDLLQRDPTQLDLLLRDGDVVRVERLVRSIRIDGEVKHPGILTYRAGDSIEDYIGRAGGFTSRAWRGKTRISRAVTGQTLLARNVRALDAGDFIWVPERPDRTVWEQAKDVLGVLTSVATIVIAIRTLK